MATEQRQLLGVFGAVPRYDSGPEIWLRMERDTQHEQSSNAAQPGSCGEAMVWALRGNEVFGDWLPQMYFSA